jgi:prepilin-type N-terminal cleavage/methylation domain-containing protein
MLRADAPGRRRPRRAAFTLVELLVVIAIIAVLISLSAAAVLRVLGVQQSSNTKTVLTTLESRLQKQWSAASERFRKEPLPPKDPVLAGVYNNVVLPNLAGGDPQRARVIWVKLRLKQEFPETINEALNPAPMPPLDQYPNGLTAGYGFTVNNTYPNNGAPAPQPWESSAMLLAALTRGEGGNQLTPADLGVSTNIKEFGPTFNPQLPTISALVDGWGKPLAFCRWPAGSPQLNPGGAQPGNKNDAGDPTGLLTSPSWLNSQGATTFQQVCHPLPKAAANGEPQSYRLVPLVVSPGQDGNLALDPFTFAVTPPNNPAANDNLYPTLNANP